MEGLGVGEPRSFCHRKDAVRDSSKGTAVKLPAARGRRVHAGPALRGGGNDVDVSAVAKIIYQAGVAEGMRVAAELLVNVLTAGSNDDDESAEGNAEEMSPA